MSEAPEDIGEHAYDHIAQWYLEWVESDMSPRQRYTKKLLNKLPPSPSVLELRCGPGVPLLNMLVDRGTHVTANDISAKQIEMAKARCPHVKFVAGNMATLTFEAESFHSALSFYTLFRLPRSQLKDLLAKMYRWIKPGGLFVFNLAGIDEEEFHGEMIGFELLKVEKVKAGDGKLEEDEPDYESEFVWVMARKPDANKGEISEGWSQHV
ncbi:sterol 24-c-methyltransferase-like protein [Stemphylium lycopersici]|nr:sterol 24-c-methyltransferase-like protein [Stemphylium lycopersici]